MRPDLWPRVIELMHRALDVPESERRAWIEARAAGDAEVVAEVCRLLDAHESAGRFLDVPLIAQPGAATAVGDALPEGTEAELGSGRMLGPYRILREIGRGGMGTVYLGARADDVFDKLVAIKVAPGALVSEALRERFNRERHLLAALDHAGIARVIDGGATTTGLQYLVMEYVDGMPIDVYCHACQLGVDARLRLFVDVCRAVQYAHDHLIVHRDIKASNVLVGEDGCPKLLDFGIAKLLARSDRARDPGVTLVQAWTPESASPEQVRGEPTTVATDVYGLGALLYRLLSGRPVFDLSGCDPVERVRIICEVEPERPGAIAARTTGRSDDTTVSADLGLITLKALHKEPARRYRSAEQLAEDVERHLGHRPVLAAPDSWRYRARKFIGRHPAATAASALAVLAVLSATATALWQARRADRERDRAEAGLTDVRRLANTLIFDVYDRVRNMPNATPLRQTLVEQGLVYLDRLAVDAGTDPQLSLELAEAYRRLAEVQGDPGQPNLGDRQGALASLEKGRSLLASIRARPAGAVEVELADLRLLRQLARVVPASDSIRALALVREGVERAEALRSRFPERHDVIEAQANAYFSAALAAEPVEALPLWTSASRVFGDLVGRVPDEPTHLRGLALTEKYIGAHHHAVHRLDLARAHYERALELDRRVQVLRPDDRHATMDLAFDLGNVASVLWEAVPPDLVRVADLYRESLALRERAVTLDPRDVSARQAMGYALVQLSDLSLQLGKLNDAVGYGRRGVEIYESLPASEQLARRGSAWLSLGRALGGTASHTEQCAAFRRAGQYYTQAEQASPRERQMLRPDAVSAAARALEACPAQPPR
ncbi:MAG: serine/threonine protein kinase [Acidobacteria bacterium]|nr:serine/threonine protein kinase [Acidobacteriota bacterium]